MTQISISLKNNTEREQTAKELLERILNKYNLNRWILCKDVVIEQDATGKAFPIIRLSAWKDNEEGMMAQFLHEQFHWIEKDKEEQMNIAISELKNLFPNAPMDKPEGGGNENSTYNHLMICRLEFLALKEILGEETATRIVSGNKNYTWIRRMVIERASNIDQVIRKHFPEVINQ
ncbi:MAG: hypothetical protein HYT69_02765 [Candidatus Zambryskibacteria bacterium]|nr:hypothetical protein [Candidatus Zambryskibacteria bacterium]